MSRVPSQSPDPAQASPAAPLDAPEDTAQDDLDGEGDPPAGRQRCMRFLATLIAQEIRRGGHGTPPAQVAPPSAPKRGPYRPQHAIRCVSRP